MTTRGNIGVTSSLYIRRSELFFFFKSLRLVTVLPQLYELAGQTLGIIESSNSQSYIIIVYIMHGTEHFDDGDVWII